MIHGRRKLVKSNGRQSGYSTAAANFRTGGGGGRRGGGGWGGRGGGGGDVYLTAGVKEYQRRKEERKARDKSPVLGNACREILAVGDNYQRRASRIFEEISPLSSPANRKRLSVQAGSLSQLQGQVAVQGRRLTCFWDNKLQGVFTGVSVGKDEVEEEEEEEKQEEGEIVEEKNGEERRVKEREDQDDDAEDEEEEGSPPRRGCRPWICAMDMFTLLKNSMGADDVNPILKHFSLGRQTGSAGVEMTWKIYEAVRLEDKKVSDVHCVVFLLSLQNLRSLEILHDIKGGSIRWFSFNAYTEIRINL
ncbi:SCY1-like protein 2 isoform X5 [Elysia marginata]|uniref:SCY1-like protein 2 isoform X5 n=1 Tax=Elysia marginata TaxID=1093978 RepID=A0AAV4IIC6_9GAST|nr:SCY1-like protein 2 isoform X5 [Elysia marginata]